MIKSVTIYYPGTAGTTYHVGDKTPGKLDIKRIVVTDGIPDRVTLECENSSWVFQGLPFCLIEENS
jgi:hypothetical protein